MHGVVAIGPGQGLRPRPRPRLRPEDPFQLELEPERIGQVREPPHVLLEPRRFAELGAEHHLVVDQVEDRLGVVVQLGLALEVGLHRGALAPPPASALVRQQQGEQGPGVGRSGHGSSSRPSSPATRSIALDSFLRSASAPPPSRAATAAQSSPSFLSSRIWSSSGASRRRTSCIRSRASTSPHGPSPGATSRSCSGPWGTARRRSRRWVYSLRAWTVSLLRAMADSSFVNCPGVSSSNWPAAARRKKLFRTDWQMSIESSRLFSRASASRTRTARRIAGS